MANWIFPSETSPPVALQQYVGGHPLVAQVLAQRGITTPARARGFLDHRLYEPAPGTDLPGLSSAADRIELAIRSSEAICVWGDFDVDGQTASTLLVQTLRDLGAIASYHIPIRATESHGIRLPALKEALAQGTQLVLTCDTGIAEHEAIEYAQSRGVDVVVTDHHTLPPALPNAHALVNPQMLPPDHPLRDLPGVGVAYKLAEELYARAGRPDEAEELLDLAALGIVADVAVQRADTRYLLQRGLDALRETNRLGLRTLFETAELNPAQLSEEHIGFAIGPRMNALGRLGDANGIVEFLTTEDLATARVVAQQLEGLNAQRKLLTSQIYQAALAQCEQEPGLLDFAALVLAHPAWEPGVLGIVAGRLAERFQRPVVLLAGGNGDIGVVRGSARSVEGVNITAAIAAQEAMLIGFGGHPMAAGVSLEAEKVPAFRAALSKTVEEMRGVVEAALLQIDAFLPLGDLSLALVEDINRLAPFGAGNRPLTLATGNLVLKNATVIGRTQEHLQLFVEDEGGDVQKVFWWQGADNPLPEGKFDLAYTVRASDYRGERQMQVAWVDFRPVERETVEVQEVSEPTWEDYREVDDPPGMLQELQERGVQVWAEGETDPTVKGVNRLALAPAKELAVWTTPPGQEVWQSVLEGVKPGKVYIFAREVETDRTEEFLKRLAGLLKFALRTGGGQVTVARLSAATAQREGTVQTGLEWLEGKGMFEVRQGPEGDVEVRAGTGRKGASLNRVEDELNRALEETRAYRRYFREASVEALQGRKIPS